MVNASDCGSEDRGFESHHSPHFPLLGHHIGMSPSGKAPDFDSGIRRFESCHPSHVGARRALLRFFPRLGVFVAADRAVSAAVMRGGQDISIRPVRRYRPLPCRSETAPCCRPGMENVKNDPLAQQAEQLPFKQWVWSSNLQRVTIRSLYEHTMHRLLGP